jgi:hypothetical protein
LVKSGSVKSSVDGMKSRKSGSFSQNIMAFGSDILNNSRLPIGQLFINRRLDRAYNNIIFILLTPEN